MNTITIYRDNITGVTSTIFQYQLSIALVVVAALFMFRDINMNWQWRFLVDYSLFIFNIYILFDDRKDYLEAKIARLCDKYRDAACLYS